MIPYDDWRQRLATDTQSCIHVYNSFHAARLQELALASQQASASGKAVVVNNLMMTPHHVFMAMVSIQHERHAGADRGLSIDRVVQLARAENEDINYIDLNLFEIKRLDGLHLKRVWSGLTSEWNRVSDQAEPVPNLPKVHVGDVLICGVIEGRMHPCGKSGHDVDSHCECDFCQV